MFLQLKALYNTIAGIVAAIATWLLIDASGLTSTELIDHGESSVADHGGYFLYQFTFCVLLCLMTAAADGIFREIPQQRRSGYLVALALGLSGGLLAPGIGIAFAAMF